MRPIVLVSVGGLGVVGSLTGAGVAINHFYGGESIRAYIEKTKKSQNKIFLASGNVDLQNILNEYEKSKRFKPLDKDSNKVTKNDLVKWCESAIEGKYYGEKDNNFKGVDSWCFINTNSFAKELESRENKKLSEEAAVHEHWTGAWTKYSTERDTSNLKIIDEARKVDLDGSVANKGALALHGWCKEKLNIKLYVDDAEQEFKKFSHWCPKVSAG